MVQRSFSATGFRTYSIDESRSDNMSAIGAVTVNFMLREISANGSITITRNAAFVIKTNGTITRQGSETESSTITFSSGSGEVLEHFGPLKGHPSGTTVNITINGQTYLAVHVSRSFTNHFSSSATESFTKNDGGKTFTVNVDRTVTRDISLSADFWFSQTSGILLKSNVQGNISVQVTATGKITGPMGFTENFTLNATYTEAFLRTVMATSISGLSG